MFDYEYWGLSSLSPSASMALEEFFLKRAAAGKAVVRFFDFSRDAIILGYAQAPDCLHNRDRSFDVVRRPTGGSHIQLGRNTLAYSFAVPRDSSFKNYEDMRAYYSGLVARSLEDLGLEAHVDNKASTIMIDNRVVASHALIWGVQSALLHGLVVLEPYDIDLLARRIFLQTRKIGNKQYSELSAIRNIPALSTLLQKNPQLLKKLLAETILKNVTRGKHVKKCIDTKILSQAREIQEQKYGKEDWTTKRAPPFTKEEIETIPGEELTGTLKKNLGYCLYSQVRNKDFKKMADL